MTLHHFLVAPTTMAQQIVRGKAKIQRYVLFPHHGPVTELSPNLQGHLWQVAAQLGA